MNLVGWKSCIQYEWQWILHSLSPQIHWHLTCKCDSLDYWLCLSTPHCPWISSNAFSSQHHLRSYVHAESSIAHVSQQRILQVRYRTRIEISKSLKPTTWLWKVFSQVLKPYFSQTEESSDTMLKVWSKIELWALGCIDRAWVTEVWSKVAKVEPQGNYSIWVH